MPIKDLIENCKTEMGPKVFEQFRLDVAGEKVASGKPMVPCWCNGTGFTDNVDRGLFAMEPADKICPHCNGRGWLESEYAR